MKSIKFASLALTILLLLLSLACSDKGTDPSNRPPVFSSSSTAIAVEGELFNYMAAASDPDGDNITIVFDNIPGWMDTMQTMISGTPSTGMPDTAFTVIASDGELTATLTVSVTVSGTQPPPISYSSQIQPIFNSRCIGCHVGGNQGGLSIDNYASLMQGGNSGAVVAPGNPDGSLIVQRVEGTVQPRMPFGQSPLTPQQIQLIRDWIEQGAHDN